MKFSDLAAEMTPGTEARGASSARFRGFRETASPGKQSIPYDTFLKVAHDIAATYTPAATILPATRGHVDDIRPMLKALYEGDAAMHFPGWSPDGPGRSRSAAEEGLFLSACEDMRTLSKNAPRTPATWDAILNAFAVFDSLQSTLTIADFSIFWLAIDELRPGSQFRRIVGLEKIPGKINSGGLGGHYLMTPIFLQEDAVTGTMDWWLNSHPAYDAVRRRLHFWLQCTLHQLSKGPTLIADLACGCSYGMAILQYFATPMQIANIKRYVALDYDPDAVAVARRISKDVAFPVTVLQGSLLSRSFRKRLVEATKGEKIGNCLIAGFWDYFADDKLMTRWLAGLREMMNPGGLIVNGVFSPTGPDVSWMKAVWPLVGRRENDRLYRVGAESGFTSMTCFSLNDSQNLQVLAIPSECDWPNAKL